MTHFIQRDYLKFNAHRLEFKDAQVIAKSICKWSQVYELQPEWILSMFSLESHFDCLSEDGLGSYGIPQLQVETAQAVVKEDDLKIIVTYNLLKMDTDLSIHLACHHFRDLLEENKGDYVQSTRAYNCGQNRAKRTKITSLKYLIGVTEIYYNYLKQVK